MSGWGSPRAAEVNIGGRSPRAVDGKEKERVSRRLGLTHSLTSPRRTPDPAASKPELPSRPPADDYLPRPRSLSPRRTPIPPSVTGSTLSARIERASFVRASNAPSVPPPPQTRARFSARREELDEGGDYGDGGNGVSAAGDGGCAAPVAPSGFGVDEPLTPTPASGGSGRRVAALALAIESQRLQQEEPQQDNGGGGDDDEPPEMTLPAVITAAQSARLAADKRMRDSRSSQPQPQPRQGKEGGSPATSVGIGMGVKRVERVRGRGAVAPGGGGGGGGGGNGSIASSSDFGTAATPVFGTGKSQIQASPQFWVPKKLSRSPINKNKSASSYSPSRSTRPLW